MTSIKQFLLRLLILVAFIFVATSFWLYSNYAELSSAYLKDKSNSEELVQNLSQFVINELQNDTLELAQNKVDRKNFKLISQPFFTDSINFYVKKEGFFLYQGKHKDELNTLYQIKLNQINQLEPEAFEWVLIVLFSSFIFATVILISIYFYFSKKLNTEINKVILSLEKKEIIRTSNLAELAKIQKAITQYQLTSEQSEKQTVVIDMMNHWRNEVKKIIHDLKNPLQRILLAINNPTNDDQRVLAKQAIDEISMHLKSIRSTELNDQIEIKKIDIALAIEHLSSLFYDIEISYTKTFSDDFYFDNFAFQRICSNLIINAIEAGANKILFSFEKDRDLIKMLIANNGKEIKNREKLFVPFNTSKANGSGLGLVIILQLVHQHHGTFYLKSSDAKETCFIMELREDLGKRV